MVMQPIRGGSLSEAEVVTAPRAAWQAPAERSESPLVQGLRRLRRSGTALVGVGIVGVLLVVAIFANLLGLCGTKGDAEVLVAQQSFGLN